jgi:hypothetical protein
MSVQRELGSLAHSLFLFFLSCNVTNLTCAPTTAICQITLLPNVGLESPNSELNKPFLFLSSLTWIFHYSNIHLIDTDRFLRERTKLGAGIVWKMPPFMRW